MSVMETREAFFNTVARINAERAAARPLVDELRMSSSEAWDQDVPVSWRTAGFVQELTAAAVAILEDDPQRSLELAQLALAVVTSIPEAAYPPPVQGQLEGTAWKEIGNAHRYLNEHDAALRAFDAAEGCFASSNTMDHDLAILEFARGVVLSDAGQHEAGRRLIDKALPVLRGFGDQRRVMQATMMIGAIQWRQAQFTEARATYEDALREAPQDDLHTRAALYGNLGRVCVDLGDLNDAVLMLHQSRALFNELGMTGEATRIDWTLARALMHTGHFERAIPMLERARDAFLVRGMIDEAGLAGLLLVDALLAANQANRARELAERVLVEFTAAKLNDRAITALAYLRDILPTARDPQRAVRHVRTYLEELRNEPSRVFLPLPEEH